MTMTSTGVWTSEDFREGARLLVRALDRTVDELRYPAQSRSRGRQSPAPEPQQQTEPNHGSADVPCRALPIRWTLDGFSPSVAGERVNRNSRHTDGSSTGLQLVHPVMYTDARAETQTQQSEHAVAHARPSDTFVASHESASENEQHVDPASRPLVATGAVGGNTNNNDDDDDDGSECFVDETVLHDPCCGSIDGTQNPSDATGMHRRTVEWRFSVLHSDTWRVPVLYFRAQHQSNGWPLLRSEVMSHIDTHHCEGMQDTWEFVSEDIHPVTGVPSFVLHPCRTTARIKQLMSASSQYRTVDNESIQLQLTAEQRHVIVKALELWSWMTLVLPVVRQPVPSHIFRIVQRHILGSADSTANTNNGRR